MRELFYKDGIWISNSIDEMSYPDEGNAACYQVEDLSFWFQNRNRQIFDFLKADLGGRLPSTYSFLDVGAGNGFVARAVQIEGYETTMVEPGDGVYAARSRGVKNIYKCTLADLPEDLRFDYIGFFDVLEHLENPEEVLKMASLKLKPEGKILATVPAYQMLFSLEDVAARHYRRYTKASLKDLFEKSDLSVSRASYFFMALLMPIFLLRTIPFWLGIKEDTKKAHDLEALKRSHSHKGFLLDLVDRVFCFERKIIGLFGAIPFGASIIILAKKK